MARYFSFLLLSLLVSCSGIPTGEERKLAADQLALANGWRPVTLSTGAFDLRGYLPAGQKPADRLTVYIEGDGFSWRTPSLPSSDPTPINPLALKLALAHPDGNAAYLARPCQYNKSRNHRPCPQRYWTGSRFAPEVISAMNRALDQLKERYQARHLTLVGYSGGGAVAVLLAARRDDIDRLVTVAGNLDHRAWTSMHKIASLDGSLNPVDYVEKLGHTQQWHFAGENDEIVPAILARSFVAKFPPENGALIRVVPGFDHHCCWAEHWPRLWSTTEREGFSGVGVK
jgi:hypothetical protein